MQILSRCLHTSRYQRRGSSSQDWLRRQAADPFVKQRDRAGLRSRSGFKLAQLNEKFKFLKPGHCVVDLGGAPGGWSQIAAQLIGRPERGALVCCDLLEVEPLFGVHTIQGNALERSTQRRIVDAMKKQLNDQTDGPIFLDCVLSDMAPSMSGQPDVDRARQKELYEAAVMFSMQYLRPDHATLVMKFFTGPDNQSMTRALEACFRSVTIAKPPASRMDSGERFWICQRH